MCPESGVFIQQCENVKTCGYYSETRFPLYIVPKFVYKSETCPRCKRTTVKEFVVCTYKTANKETQNLLQTRRCSKCERNYINETLYNNYVRSKKIEDLDVVFKRIT